MANGLDFVQIYYREDQRAELYDFSVPYFNETLTPWFENSIIAKVVPELKEDYIGVASWRLRKKRNDCQLGLGNNLTLTAEKILNSGADVCILTPRSPIHKPLVAAQSWHGSAWVEAFGIFKGFLAECGLKVPGELRYAIYENHFVARRDIYHDYVSNYLIPAIAYMDGDKRFLAPSGYNEKKKDRAEKELVHKSLNLTDWPIGVFVLERFFSIYLESKELIVKPL